MKLSHTASRVLVLGSLALLSLFLFAGVVYGMIGFSADNNAQLVDSFLLQSQDAILTWVAITSIGSWYTMAGLVAVFGYVLLKTGRKYHAGILAGVYIVGQLSALLLKDVYEIARPNVALVPVTSFGFPSGHSLITLAVLGTMIVFVWKFNISTSFKRWGFALASITIVAVGLSRITLGAHFPNDVLGGWFLGGVFVAITFLLHVLRKQLGVKAGTKPSRELLFKASIVSALVVLVGIIIHYVILFQ